jgi:DNA-binding MarR family transcriptional regulator
MSERPLRYEQQAIVNLLRRGDKDWYPAWEIAKALGYTFQKATANLREMHRRELVTRRYDPDPEWSLRGPQ